MCILLASFSILQNKSSSITKLHPTITIFLFLCYTYQKMSEEQPEYLGTWKGRVIKAIAIDGARTYKEILESTGLYHNTLKKVLAELHNSDSIEYNKKTQKYWVTHNLYKEYEKYFQDKEQMRISAPIVKISKEDQEEFSRWIDVWKDNKDGVDFSLQYKHFYPEKCYTGQTSYRK